MEVKEPSGQRLTVRLQSVELDLAELQLTPQMRILVAIEPQNFRRGIDGMARVCQAMLASDPLSGTAYVFRNRRGTSIKITGPRPPRTGEVTARLSRTSLTTSPCVISDRRG